jgi:hypothetical protein
MSVLRDIEIILFIVQLILPWPRRQLVVLLRDWFVCLSAVDLFVGCVEGADVLDFFDQPKEQAFLFFSCVSTNGARQATPCYNFIFFGNHVIRRVLILIFGGAARVLFESAICRRQEQKA